MPIFETYASRNAAATRAESPELYVYDRLPPLLRRQISKIFAECIGPDNPSWCEAVSKMDREIASFSNIGPNPYATCDQYLKTSADIDGALSLVEICANVMANAVIDERSWRGDGATVNPLEGLRELNKRFLLAEVGYQFENGQIIRLDNKYVHAEVVREALRLLSQPEFREANSEFMTAHQHLRQGRCRDCNTAALRATENVLKVICKIQGWHHEQDDTIERLIAKVRRNGLFPDYLGGYFDSLIGAMKAGGPKIRDRQGAHGAAPGDAPVPDHIAVFSLHLAAANIIMLVTAHRALPTSL